MLEAHILMYLISLEGGSGQREGRLTGWSLAHLQMRYDVPKSTFYRAVNVLLSQEFINKQKRGYYTLSSGMRLACNKVPSSKEVRS